MAAAVANIVVFIANLMRNKDRSLEIEKLDLAMLLLTLSKAALRGDNPERSGLRVSAPPPFSAQPQITNYKKDR
jgi:hypothetical protein